MKALDKLKNIFTQEEIDIDEVETQNLASYENPRNQNMKKVVTSGTIKVFDARDFHNDAEEMVTYLKYGNACVINYKKLSSDSAQRLLDYIGGAVFALGGELVRTDEYSVICCPKTIQIDIQNNESE